MLAPGGPAHPVQLIDARDIAAWALHCAETKVAGMFNTTGPAVPLTIGDVLATIATVAGAKPNLVWVSDEFLLGQGIQPLDGVPLWVPPEYRYFFKVDVGKAIAAGLSVPARSRIPPAIRSRGCETPPAGHKPPAGWASSPG